MKLTIVPCCSGQQVFLHELKSTMSCKDCYVFQKCQGCVTVHTVHVVRNQAVIPKDRMNVSESINDRKKKLGHIQGDICTYHTNIHSGKLGHDGHLLAFASIRDVNLSAKTQWAEFKLTSLVFLTNAAWLRQRDKTAANQTPPHQRRLIKSSIYLRVALDKLNPHFPLHWCSVVQSALMYLLTFNKGRPSQQTGVV